MRTNDVERSSSGRATKKSYIRRVAAKPAARPVALPAAQPYKTRIDTQDPLYPVMQTKFESIDRSADTTIEEQIIDFFKVETEQYPSDIAVIKINLIGKMIRLLEARYDDIRPVIFQGLELQDIRIGSPFLQEIDNEFGRVSKLLAPPTKGHYQVKVQPMTINTADYTRIFNNLFDIINNDYIDIPNKMIFKKSSTDENTPISIDDYLVTIDFIIAKKMIPDPLFFLLYNVEQFNGYVMFNYRTNPIFNLVDDSFHIKHPEIGFTDIKPILQRVMMYKSYFKFLSDKNHEDIEYLKHYLHCLIILKNLIPVIMEGRGPEYSPKTVKTGGKSRNKRNNKRIRSKTNRRKTIRRRKNKNNRHKSIRRKER